MNSDTYPWLVIGASTVLVIAAITWRRRPALRRNPLLLFVLASSASVLIYLLVFLLVFLATLSTLDMRDF
jgi:hypothetical protein